MTIVITRPRGAEARERYLVAQVLSTQIRTYRCDHIGIAQSVVTEWSRARYHLSPGIVRPLNCQLDPAP